MRSYEGLFVFPPEATNEVREGQGKTLEEMIQKFGGSVTQKIDYGRKLMGYAIKKSREGYFLLLDFQLPPAKMDGLKKGFQLYEGLLHFMITVKDEKMAQKTEASAIAAGSKTAGVTPSPTS